MKKVVKIGINGFGRIGRLVLRAASSRKDVKVVAINDPFIDLEYSEYMFVYDTVHRKFEGETAIKNGKLVVNGNAIAFYGEREPSLIPWKKHDVDVVIEATGKFTKYEDAVKHIEAGAKNGIFAVDEVTKAYQEGRVNREYTVYEADPDAVYDAVYDIDLSTIKPTVAFPHLPENTRTIDNVGEVKIDQVVIGSCTNGRMEDLEMAARILDGKKVHDGVRCIVIPATQKIYLEAMKKGLLEIFINAGCAVSTPTCGPCLGGHMGILAKGERAVATTNRNFVGRMGHPESEVYLASPAVAAASAVTGKISCPCEIM